jgi:hypothetical protein
MWTSLFANSVGRVEGPGVDYRWCPLTQRIGLTSCVVTGVTIRRSPVHTVRQDVSFGHQIRGQVEWSLNNPKDPTFHRMIKVLSRMTKGAIYLLSFLKDRDWGSPGDKRKKSHWDLMRADQQVPDRVTVEQKGKVSPSDREGVQDQLTNEEVLGTISIAPPPITVTTSDTDGHRTGGGGNESPRMGG